jgi:ribosomal protein S18 acetylase RimI-like enzyme
LLDLWRGQHADAVDTVGQATQMKRGKDIEATVEAIGNYETLGLKGLVLYAGQDLVGFTFGEMLGNDACSILIEKTDRAYTGSAQYIFSEFCRRAWAHTLWCNAGDDWDIPSLAYTKQSYRPAFRIDKWRMVPPTPVMASVPATMPDLAHATAAEPAAALGAGLAGDQTVCEDAVLADVESLAMLDRRSFTVKLAITRRQFRYLIKSPSATVRVIRHEGHPVASVVILRQRTQRGVLARLYSLAVDSEFRGRGLGRRLATDALDRLRAEGLRNVILEVEEDNTAALRLYEKLGFQKTRYLRDYYDQGIHGWKMRCDLQPATTTAATLAAGL